MRLVCPIDLVKLVFGILCLIVFGLGVVICLFCYLVGLGLLVFVCLLCFCDLNCWVDCCVLRRWLYFFVFNC